MDRPLPRLGKSFSRLEAGALVAVLLSHSPDCIKLLDPAGRLDFISRNGLCAMEIDDASTIIGRYWWELWPPSEQDHIHKAIDKARHGETVRFEACCPTAKGNMRRWSITLSPIHDDNGTVQGMLSTSRDISDIGED